MKDQMKRNVPHHRITNLFRGGVRGFSILELIMVLVLVGILGLMGTMGFVHFSKGFVMAKDTAAVSAKGQLAMMRLAKEIQSLSSASAATSTRLAYTALRSSGSENHEVRLAGANLLFDNQILVDRVSSFTINYYNAFNSGSSSWSASTRLLELNLTLNGPENTPVSLQTRVALRNV